MPPDKSRNRKSPEAQLNEQPRTLLSPLGSKGSAFNPVTKSQSSSSIETLSNNYMNGQWPREQNGNGNFVMVPKGTQTAGNWEDPLSDDIIQLSLEQKRQSLAISSASSSTTAAAAAAGGGSKEVFRHHL